MADRNKFEEMLERLINEDKSGAEELFHEIVVAKSRDIYESLLESDLDEIDEANKDDDEDEVDESSHDKDDEDEDEDGDKVDESSEDDDLDENFNLDEFEVEGEDDMGGDPTDDMMGDLETGSSDDDMGGEGSMEDRVVDLEDALDDLKAEFEKMMSGEDGDEESDDEGDMDDMGGDEEGEEGDEKEAYNFGEAEDDEVEEGTYAKSNTEQMREYVEKVSGGGLDASKIGGDNGANAKSTVAGKNDMGGTSANIVKGGQSKGEGTNGGLAAPTTKEENARNVNVPGGKASKSMKAEPKGHGAEKKSAGDNGANKKSIIGGK